MRDQENGRLQILSQDHPILFALLITMLMLLLYVAAAIMAQIIGRSIISFNLIEAAGRLAGALIFVAIIFRLRWQDETGLTRAGARNGWLLATVALVYEVLTFVYPYLADLNLAQANWGETLSVAVNAITTGPLEEIPFRGLVLTAFIRLWGGSKRGVWRAVLLSAFIFGASHMIHILFGRELTRATLLALNAGLGGVFYAAVVLRWGTIWPAVFLHSGLNSLAGIVAFNVIDYVETPQNLLVTLLFQIPLLILAAIILGRIEARSPIVRPV